MNRFIIEGTWSGYTSNQKRVVHRTVHKGAFKKLRAWAEKTNAIYYSDGTALYLEVRDAKPRERVELILGYSGLIQDCAFYGVNSVESLSKSRAEFRLKPNLPANPDEGPATGGDVSGRGIVR